MPTAMLETADEVILRWRSSPDADSPAGPLYAARVFAEADIAAPDMTVTFAAYCSAGGPCSICSASNTVACC